MPSHILGRESRAARVVLQKIPGFTHEKAVTRLLATIGVPQAALIGQR
jgi:hypothetical protein